MTVQWTVIDKKEPSFSLALKCWHCLSFWVGRVLSCRQNVPVAHFRQKKSPDFSVEAVVLALPIFPGSRPPSIVGADELNFCVRDGNRWTLIAINTNYFIGDPYRIRTDVNGVRGRCLNHLTNGPLVHLQGLEPGTH